MPETDFTFGHHFSHQNLGKYSKKGPQNAWSELGQIDLGDTLTPWDLVLGLKATLRTPEDAHLDLIWRLFRPHFQHFQTVQTSFLNQISFVELKKHIHHTHITYTSAHSRTHTHTHTWRGQPGCHNVQFINRRYQFLSQCSEPWVVFARHQYHKIG